MTSQVVQLLSEVWEANKGQAGSLEYIILDGAKRILGYSSKICNEAVRGDEEAARVIRR